MEAIPVHRYRIDESEKGTRVIIPRRRQWLAGLFLTFWLGGWGFGEVLVLSQLLFGEQGHQSGFLLFWFGGWTVAGAFAIWTWIQFFFGTQTVVVGQGILSLSTMKNPFCPLKEYDLTAVRKMRVSAFQGGLFGMGGTSGMDYWYGGPPMIQFDYGASTVGFGNGMDEAEAKELLHELKKRLSDIDFS